MRHNYSFSKKQIVIGKFHLTELVKKNKQMKRSKELLDKRKTFIHNYVEDNSAKQMKVIINELVNKLFISEKTIYNILKQ